MCVICWFLFTDFVHLHKCDLDLSLWFDFAVIFPFCHFSRFWHVRIGPESRKPVSYLGFGTIGLNSSVHCLWRLRAMFKIYLCHAWLIYLFNMEPLSAWQTCSYLSLEPLSAEPLVRRLALLIHFVILGHAWLIYSFIYWILNPLVRCLFINTPQAVQDNCGVLLKFEFCDLKN
jgi:hypothetical protein